MEVRGPETTIRDLPSGRWWAFPTPDVEPARLALQGARARDALAPANDHAAPPAHVIAMGDAHGNRIDLDRDPAGRLRAVRHTDGHHLRVETLPDGRYLSVDLVSDPAGADFSPIRLLTCRFDARGHLTFVDARTTGIYRYETDATGRVTRWSDGGSTWSELFYDDADRVVETRAADGLYGARFAYDDAAGTVTCLADDGAVTQVAVREPRFGVAGPRARHIRHSQVQQANTVGRRIDAGEPVPTFRRPRGARPG